MAFDTFSVARQHAAQMREYYEAYVSVGFSHEDAIAFVLIIMKALAHHEN